MGRVVLQMLQSLSTVPLESLAETADQDAFLCNSCENELVSIRNLGKKVGELKVEIVERVVEPQRSIADTLKRTLEESIQPFRKKLHLWLLVGIYASFQRITSSSSSRGISITAGPPASPDHTSQPPWFFLDYP